MAIDLLMLYNIDLAIYALGGKKTSATTNMEAKNQQRSNTKTNGRNNRN
jgi:hypothetical protein